MHDYQTRFLELAEQCGVLRFGDFTLKSGRQSPYFFNLGNINSGAAMQALADAYAEAILAAKLEFDMLFGPAYKGIPLVTAVALALAQRGHDYPFAFNRKEAKDHGEGGNIVGAPLQGRVLILDDVLTAGTAAREAITLIRNAGAEPVAAMLAFDRQEKGQGTQSATQELAKEQQLAVAALVGLSDLEAWLRASGDADKHAQIARYREQYGV
ncbi:orotate phosphoribosyltransferase [Oceanococcus atlanticus]|uniref:Orotate phosphoribosyltransferase n=1 Tax=Oceanococcus atlanticus TaxID=1317117 RepID=A0A1Y1SA91_9GAMM|nr:orotate phosphoribosyltransferase [Oceanococcus atlanticus]ORE85247.1 orotate phosphoribosyltransferase [Oceanococcus atlanticus]RZO83981.1 MAG: orotate phosphoribosyltransferase [Oceanococcus sp.]